MGTTARLWLWRAPAGLEPRLRARLDDLERLWSRFLPDSEVSALNASAGEPVPVSPETLELVDKALQGSRRTRGWFDPLLLDDLCLAGYDRPFTDLGEAPALVATLDARTPTQVLVHDWSARARHVRIDTAAGTVAVPAGAAFDPGGIGKGLAADIVAAAAVHGGAVSVLVDLGGDLVCAGSAPRDGWHVDVDDPFRPGVPVARLRLPWGAVATSSTARRRWRHGDDVGHHLIDPATRRPSTSDVAAATVVAGTCWYAEVHAKAAVLAGVDAGLELLAAGGVEGLVVAADGAVHATAGMGGFLA